VNEQTVETRAGALRNDDYRRALQFSQVAALERWRLGNDNHVKRPVLARGRKHVRLGQCGPCASTTDDDTPGTRSLLHTFRPSTGIRVRTRAFVVH